VDIWGPCLRTGSIVVPHRVSVDGAMDLLKLQRYYTKSYRVDVNPGTAGNYSGREQLRTTTNAGYGKVMFPVTMRTAPTVSIYNDATGAVNSCRNLWTSADLAVGAVLFPGETSFVGFNLTGGTSRDDVTFHYTADADF
jgi:hypothetical protein